jgi:diguanylate cyclase (GGDEF)-like protein
VQAWFSAGADEVITGIFSPAEQRARLDAMLVRTERDVSVHPSTRLPGTTEIEREIRRRLESDMEFAVCYADLDHFKEFNDRFGHPAGDEALRVFAHLMASSIREPDVAARYGGEEFAIYLAGAGSAEAAEVAERIRERTETTIIPLGPGLTGRLTVSIGYAVAPDDSAERVLLMKAADDALYRAKLAGRNRVVGREPLPLEAAAMAARSRRRKAVAS